MGSFAAAPGGQSVADARLVYRTHFYQTDTEGESGEESSLVLNFLHSLNKSWDTAMHHPNLI